MTSTGATLHAFAESAEAAGRLASAAGIPCRTVAVRGFPDGESLVRVEETTETAIVYGSLDRPNAKLVELMLAASALRDAGARRLILVAPYMCYMRQDIAFNAGEAVSQKVVGQFLDQMFDGIVTVDPHLHRTRNLSAVFPTAKTVSLSATSLFADWLGETGIGEDAVLVGPDSESRQWVQAVAQPLGLDFLIGEKSRSGDRDVEIDIPDIERVDGRSTVIIDDVISTGGTLIRCARLLLESGADSVDALTVHALWGGEEDAAFRAAGISGSRSTDSIIHPSNAIHLAPLLATGLGELLE